VVTRTPGKARSLTGPASARAVLLAGMAALGGVAGCGPADECTVGESRCDGDQVLACIHECSDLFCWNHWQGWDVCGTDGSRADGTTCFVPPGGTAMCVASTEPDPACGASGNSSYCAGDGVAACTGGYRRRTIACGATDSSREPLLPGGTGATHCIQPQPGTTTCVPPGAEVDPLCGGGSAPHCDGNVLVECTAGLAVSRTACASCSIDSSTPILPFGVCPGYLGDGCKDDSGCAGGFSCLPDSRGLLLCTAACDGVMSTYDQVFPTPSPSCLDVFRDGGPPPSGAVTEFLPGNVLACVGGRCEWLRR
jgi:hypothetical protein